MPTDGGFINGDGNSMTKATAEGRLYNHSPRLACLPGVSCGRINLPPKSGCINHGKYFSKLSQRPAIGSGVPPAREMGRMRSAYRVTEKSRRSATMPMWRWHFYNRSSAVFLHATSFYNRSSAVVANGLVSRGRRANPVLTYETALRRFPLCATSLYNRTSVVFAMHCAVGAYQRGMVLSMGDVDGWQEVFMQNYSCGDCFEVMAFRYFFL